MMKTAAIIFLSIISGLSMSDKNKNTPASLVPAELFDPTNTALPHTTTGHTKTTTGTSHTTTGHTNSTTGASLTTTGHVNTTTTHPHTTTGASLTTTGHVNTTTTHPHTTTGASHTTAAPSNTTHVPLKTTTAASNTTTPPPQPTPHTSLIPGNYNVTNEQNEVCLMAHMALQIRLSGGKSKGVFTVQPTLTSAEGSCKGTTANLTLTFREGHVTFRFSKSSTEDTVYVNALSFFLLYPLEEKGSRSSYSASNKSVHVFAAKTGHSYACSVESVFMGNGLYLDITKARVQAFNLTKTHDFGPSDFCATEHHGYHVAVAVGVTLLVLIVIVVVVYFVTRRRRTGGYQLL